MTLDMWILSKYEISAFFLEERREQREKGEEHGEASNREIDLDPVFRFGLGQNGLFMFLVEEKQKRKS